MITTCGVPGIGVGFWVVIRLAHVRGDSVVSARRYPGAGLAVPADRPKKGETSDVNQLEILAGTYVFRPDERPRGGGFSVVRKATNIRTGETVAVKFVSGAGDSVVRKLFEREATLLRQANHPNIIRLIDSGIDETDTPYLVLDWVENNLRDLIDSLPVQPWDTYVSDVLRPIADAIAYLHSIEIEHRDIKPINILANQQNVPLLADFGIAKLRRQADDTSLTLSNIHTHLWSPPEHKDSVPFVRDVFALGVLLIDGLTEAHLRPTEFHELSAAAERIPLPPDLRILLLETIDVSPERRPKNAIEFLRRLDRAIEQARPPAPKAHVPLYLTLTARKQLVGESADWGPATQALLEDLDGEVWAGFRKDDATGDFDRSVVFLIGRTMRVTVRVDDDSGPMRVSAVRRPEYEDLEWARNLGRRVDPEFAWRIERSATPRRAEHAIDMLLDRLAEHHEALEASADPADACQEMLAAWRRTLDAREAIATEGSDTLAFTAANPRGENESYFTLSEEPEADLLDTEWQILGPTGRPIMRGRVVQHSGSSLFVRWQWRNGKIGSATQLHPYLGPTLSALNRQRDAIRQLEVGPLANQKLLQLLASPETAQPPTPASEIDWVAELDENKQEAVRAAVGANDCIVVAGPPGTGKTRFIAETVGQYLARNPSSRVLIVSQTNVAIDNAVARLVDAGIEGVVRVGRTDDPRIAEGTRALILENQLEEWALSVRNRAEAYFASRTNESSIGHDELLGIIHLEEFISVRENRRVLQDKLRRSEEVQGQAAARAEFTDDPAHLQQEIDASRRRERQLLSDAARLLRSSDLKVSERTSVVEAAGVVNRLMAQSENAAELLAKLRLQADWLRRIATDDRLASVFLESSRVVAGTCLGFIGHQAVRDLAFDLCVIDEASKATATEALVPLVRSERFVLVGDENQLPPLDEDLLNNRNTLLAHSLSAELVAETLFSRLSARLPDSNRFVLNQQYRMISPIGNLISACFYNGSLRSPNRDGVSGYSSLGREVLWLDTSESPDRHEGSDPHASGSFLNRLEASIAIDRIEAIDASIELGLVQRPTDKDHYSLLLIAPYRSQLDELNRQIRSSRLRHIRVEIESVDAVQGREADFAVFCVTRSNADGKFGFLGERYWRRINVALSRARYGLTIIGDAQFCDSGPGGLRRVLDHIRSNPFECELRAADVSL